MTTMLPRTEVLTDEMLARFDERAPLYDRENRFFDEDFDELRDAGLPARCAVPDRVRRRRAWRSTRSGRLQRRLAYVAPATALAVNMHFYWTGVAADLLRVGDESCAWILEKAADGRVFAAGHGEAGNDMPLLLSTTHGRARRRRLGDHRPQDLRQPVAGVDLPRLPRHGHQRPGAPADRARLPAPRRRRATGSIDTWDTLGMRATAEPGHVLDKAFVPDEHVARRVPGRLRRRRPVPRRRSSPGRCSASPPSTSASPSGPTTSTVAGMPPAHVDRADPLDGPPPRGAARRRRDAHRLEADRRLPRAHVATTGRPASTTAGLAGQPRRRPSTS